ncbi:MAG TPA: peptidoglycan binding domain-containing protein, partial [Bacillota bacterium]|nr:peptidoglycan binding domain-containing protein [Bacillota bacterium]
MKRSVLIFVCMCAVVLLVSGVFVFAQNHISVSENFPKNTFINGIDCSGLDLEEAEKVLIEEWESREFVIMQDNEEIGNIKNFGFEYDIEDPLNEALLHSAINPLYTNTIKPQNNLFVPMNISRISDSFKKQFNKLKVLHQKSVTKTENAYVDMSDNDFDIVKEVYGNNIDKDLFFDTIISDIENNVFSLEYIKKDFYEKPTITSENSSLLAKQEYCRQYLSMEITYDFEDRKNTVPPYALDKMIIVKAGTVSVDRDAVAKYIKSLAAEYDTLGITREFEGTDGITVEVSGGSYGWLMDQEAEIEWLYRAVKKGKNVLREPEYLQTAFSRSENDIGDSYVEIDLGNQRMWMYKNGQLIVSSSVVTGTPTKNKPTYSGTYRLAYKQPNRVLKGEDWDGTQYESPVKYWMPFNRGQGMHDAP